MKLWFNNVVDSHRHVYEIRGTRVRIGRSADSDVVLESPFVADHAAELRLDGDQWRIFAFGDNGIRVTDAVIPAGQHAEVESGTPIELFPFSLMLQVDESDIETPQQRLTRFDKESVAMVGRLHLRLLEETDLEGERSEARLQDDEYLLSIERTLEQLVDEDASSQSAHDDELMMHVAGQGVRDALLERDEDQSSDNGSISTLLCGGRHWSRIATAVPQREEELIATCRVIERELTLDGQTHAASRVEKIDTDYWPAWCSVAPRIHPQFMHYVALRHLKKEIKDIVFGYGPLEDLLRMPIVSEIMVVDRDHIFVERGGVLHNSGRRFVSDAAIESIIQRIVSRVGRRIDKSQPLVDARLSDGSRVNAVIAPIAVSGPCLTVRKFPAEKLRVNDLVAKGSFSTTLAQFLRGIVLAHRNVVVSGGTGTGKTTLLNCLSDFIPDDERVVTVEDTAELRLSGDHVVRLETKDPNVEGRGAYSIRDLVKNALRMRPDRIVVGECRGAEALDMLQAMNTGHDGSLTTIHANNARDAMLRLEVLVQTAADLPIDSIRRQIAAAVDVVVQLTRMRDGRRCITQVAEILDVNHRTGQIEIRELFRLPELHDEEEMASSTGSLPTFIDALVTGGHFPLEAFYKTESEEPAPC